MTEQLELIKPVYVLEISITGKGLITREYNSIWEALRNAISYLEEGKHIIQGIKVDGEYVINRPSIRSFWLLLGQCPDGYWITEGEE